MNRPASTPVRGVVRYAHGARTEADDELAREEPLQIRLRGRDFVLTMRTPGHDEELAAGFLLGEGVIRWRDDVRSFAVCDRDAAPADYTPSALHATAIDDASNVLNVVLAPDVAVDFAATARRTFASSSCGLCGRASIDGLRGRFLPVDSHWTVSADALLAMPATMRRMQPTFDRTGGLHAAALFTPAGDCVVLREDVGRHNAVDKVLGHALLNALDAAGCVLLVSGRLSFEVMQKALAARVPVVAAVSAPSSLAVELARANRQTLVGFLREGRMNVYAGSERVVDGVVPSPGTPGEG